MTTTEKNYQPSTFLILALTGILAALIYAIILVRLIGLEPIIIGPLAVVFFGVYLPARYLTKKIKLIIIIKLRHLLFLRQLLPFWQFRSVIVIYFTKI